MSLMKNYFIFFAMVLIFFTGCEKQQPRIEIVNMTESIGSGFIVIESKPGNADVFMDNEFSGNSPVTLRNVVVGSHKLVVKKEGYEDFEIEVNVEAGKKSYVEADLIQIFEKEKIEEKIKPTEAIEEKIEKKQEELQPVVFAENLKAKGSVNIGKEILKYYDFSENKFTNNAQPSMDIFSRRYKDYFYFLVFKPAYVKILKKSIFEVKKEDCVNVKEEIAYLYSGQTLCVVTKEGDIAALGSSWTETENIELIWKLFN